MRSQVGMEFKEQVALEADSIALRTSSKDARVKKDKEEKIQEEREVKSWKK